MAFNAATQWEFQTTGDNTNGGGFYNATPGTSVDLALANTPVTFTDLVIDAATNTKITSATRPFTTADAGNIINITSGTNFTVQRVQILSVDGSNVATCDKAVGTTSATGGNGKMGGALATPVTALLDLSVAGNTWWVKYGVYTAAAFVYTYVGSANAIQHKLYGYNTTRGDRPAGTSRPLLALASYGMQFYDGWELKYLNFSGTSAGIITLAGRSRIIYCKALNSSSTTNRDGIVLGGNGSSVLFSEATSPFGNGIKVSYDSMAYGCYAHDCKQGVVLGATSGILSNSVVANCYLRGISITSAISSALFNTVSNCGTLVGTGIYTGSIHNSCIVGNIITGFAIGIDATSGSAYSDYNTLYDNTTPSINITAGPNDITLDTQFVSVGNIGSDLCTNGADWTGATGSTPPNDWAVKTAGTFTITAGGQSGDYLKIAHNGTNNNPEISFAFTTEVGKSYKVSYYAQKGNATNLTAKVGTTSGGAEIGYSTTHTDTDWNTKKFVSFEATATTTYFSVGATTSTSGQYVMIDTVTIYEQGEDFTPGDNMKLDIDWTKMGL